MSDTLRNALADVLELQIIQKEFGYLEKGIGTATHLGRVLLAARAALAALPEQRPQAPEPHAHEWEIWPETDGQSQRCKVCGAYRDTPPEDQFWKKPGAVKQGAPAAPALTDEQIDRIADALFSLDANDCTPARCREVIRAALASIPNTGAGDRMDQGHPAQATERGKAP